MSTTNQEDTMTGEDALLGYGRALVAEGFEVWHTRSGFRDAGWLTYRNPANGCWGTLQRSLNGDTAWQHLMPITPSREFGSSMHVEVQPGRGPASWKSKPYTLEPFTVAAARQCASPTNWNAVIGTRENARQPGYLSPSAVALHDTGATS